LGPGVTGRFPEVPGVIQEEEADRRLRSRLESLGLRRLILGLHRSPEDAAPPVFPRRAIEMAPSTTSFKTTNGRSLSNFNNHSFENIIFSMQMLLNVTIVQGNPFSGPTNVVHFSFSCITLHYTTLHYIKLHCSAVHCITITLYYIRSHHTIFYSLQDLR